MLIAFRHAILQTFVRFASCASLTSACVNHELRNSFQTRKAHLMLFIINRDPRQSVDDELHLPFHLFIRHESFLETSEYVWSSAFKRPPKGGTPSLCDAFHPVMDSSSSY